MFGQSTQSVMGKMAGFRARLRAIGAPSEHALYARKANTGQDTRAATMPTSARSSRNPKARLEHDSASMIRNGIYSGSRS
jgi:hypothetical protein